MASWTSCNPSLSQRHYLLRLAGHTKGGERKRMGDSISAPRSCLVPLALKQLSLLALCPGFIGNVSVRKADHHNNLAAPVNPTVELSQVLESHLVFHFGGLSENLFHLGFGHAIVNPLVVLPRHFRFER